MPTIASDILDEARGTYLNDPNAQTYTNTILLPHLRTAYNLLQSELESNGVPCKSEEYVVTIPAGTSELYPLPQDLVIPRVMYERQPGTTEEFKYMVLKNNIPQVTSMPYLAYWAYRTERIYLLAATQSREVKLEYQKSFPAINTADASLFGKAEAYLSAKVAALAHLFISQSTTLAEAANQIAEYQLDSVCNLQVKIHQAQPIRRKGYMPFRVS